MQEQVSIHPLIYPSGHDAALTGLLDPISIRRVEGLIELSGKRMMEVGAGGGSFAAWLAEQASPDGYVFAVDKQPRLNFEHPNLTVSAADVVAADLPGYLDFIHARLTLSHIPQRRQVLTKLIGCLKSGGVILIEDWYAADTRMVLDSPSPEATALYDRFQDTLGQIFQDTGTDRGWARHVHAAMRADGLANVQTTYEGSSWSGDSWGSKLVQSSIRQLWAQLVERGMTEPELIEICELLRRQDFVLRGHPLYSTSGHKIL